MVGKQIGKLFLFQLLLLWDLLKNSLIVLWRPNVSQHWSVDRTVGHLGALLVMVGGLVDWTLLSSTNTWWNYKIETELTRLHLFWMMVTVHASSYGESIIVVSKRTLFLGSFAATTSYVYLLKAILAWGSAIWVAITVSQFRVASSSIRVTWLLISTVRHRKLRSISTVLIRYRVGATSPDSTQLCEITARLWCCTHWSYRYLRTVLTTWVTDRSKV